MFTVNRALGPTPDDPFVEVVCEGRYYNIQSVLIESADKQHAITLTRDQLYRLVDIVGIADPDEWARRFPCEHDETPDITFGHEGRAWTPTP